MAISARPTRTASQVNRRPRSTTLKLTDAAPPSLGQPRTLEGPKMKERTRGPALSFAESISLSSTGSDDLRLPPTAFASGFDLLALRARRKKESRRGQGLWQEVQTRKRSQFARIQLSTFPQRTLQLVEMAAPASARVL